MTRHLTHGTHLPALREAQMAEVFNYRLIRKARGARGSEQLRMKVAGEPDLGIEARRPDRSTEDIH